MYWKRILIILELEPLDLALLVADQTPIAQPYGSFSRVVALSTDVSAKLASSRAKLSPVYANICPCCASSRNSKTREPTITLSNSSPSNVASCVE